MPRCVQIPADVGQEPSCPTLQTDEGLNMGRHFDLFGLHVVLAKTCRGQGCSPHLNDAMQAFVIGIIAEDQQAAGHHYD